MKKIYLNALVQLFNLNMEYWCRCEPLPSKHKGVLTWVSRRSPESRALAETAVLG